MREPSEMTRGEPLQELSGFMEELAEQARRRYAVLKREVDEELADKISERRIQVERTLHLLRTSHERLRRSGLKSNRRVAERRMAEELDRLRALLLDELEKRLDLKLRRLRESEGYGSVLWALAQEAASVLEEPLVVCLVKGDAERLRGCPCVGELWETLDDAWGGLFALDTEKGRVLDNTFRIRWKRLLPTVMRRISEHVDRYSAAWMEKLEAKGRHENGLEEAERL